MSLLVQFQLFLGLMIITFGNCFLVVLFNNLFEDRNIKVIRFVLEPFLYILFSYMYYVFIGFFADGKLNLFYLLSICIGGFIFFKFYYQVVDTYIKSKIFNIKRKVYGVLKLHYRIVDGKIFIQKEERKDRGAQN